jgi:class 3 adenylate cyclase
MNARQAFGRITAVTFVANLLGAVLTFCYFRFIDYETSPRAGSVRAGEIVYFIAGMTVLGILAVILSRRWGRPLRHPDAYSAAVVQRRALLVPHAIAGVTALGWVLAGLIWGVLWQLLAGDVTLAHVLRRVFGITVISGTVTTAFVFLATERHWRRALPAFLRDVGSTAASGAVRVSVHARLLVTSLLVSLVPLSVLGVTSYTRAASLLGADAGTAGEVVHGILLSILFILTVGGIAAAIISGYVSTSVSAPLRQLEAAMAEVQDGRLDARCAPVANDEIGALADGFNRMVGGLRDRERVREAFGKYVSREVRDEILSGRIPLDGQVREVTILFADLRDFTPWVEASPPREVVRDLNGYFTAMDEAIRAHRGLVLQFIGDEIEAVFGAPLTVAGHADLALGAALEMRRRLAEWNAGRGQTGQPLLRHGIGIHTGTVLAGNIGSAERLSYALVGDAVNLSSRIQGLTKEVGADILLSGATRRLLQGEYQLAALPALRVKGKSTEVEVFRVA